MTIHVDLGTDIPPSTLRGRLRDAREWRGLEQIDLARELGVGRSTISNYERGVTEPSKLVVNAWAVVCRVDVEWLKAGTVPAGNGGPGNGLDSSGPSGRATLAQSAERFTRNE